MVTTLLINGQEVTCQSKECGNKVTQVFTDHTRNTIIMICQFCLDNILKYNNKNNEKRPVY